MRDYSKVSGEFWTGKTGRSLRGDMQTQIIAVYLMTSRHSSMIGVFHCPILYMAHETGSPLEGATESLRKLVEGGFAPTTRTLKRSGFMKWRASRSTTN